MKRIHIPFLALLMLFVGCSKDSLTPETTAEQAEKVLSRQEINEIVLDKLNTTGEFKWNMVDAKVIHSALVTGDGVLDIGYMPKGTGDLSEKIHLIDIKDQQWQAAKNTVLNAIITKVNENRTTQIKLEDILLSEDDFFPHLAVKVDNYEVVEMLLNMDEVRFAEPGGFEDKDQEASELDRSLGCGNPNTYTPNTDYTNISPASRRPWNFNNANVTGAWNQTQGDNVTICIIDTGSSPNQPKLGSQFASGFSGGRSITRLGTYKPSFWSNNTDGPNDQCGHGTRMCGLAAAPRGYNYTPAGVAYKSDLLSIRGTKDVFLSNGKEKRGVRDALKIAGNNSGVKVISMSIGTPFYSSTVADGVYYAYNKGKMMMAAAGTTGWYLSWIGVIFPATMNQTVAVTGIKEGTPIVKCSDCHSGSKVDFTVVMQRRYDNDRTGLSLLESGNGTARTGGSSCSTATLAGVAALVWSTNTSMSRATVLQKLKNASANYPSRDSKFGWGTVNAGMAVN